VGPNPAYVEDPIEDTVTYQKDVRNPVWSDPTHTTSMATKPMSTHYKNTMGLLSKKQARANFKVWLINHF
jgi:hypothetical protein